MRNGVLAWVLVDDLGLFHNLSRDKADIEVIELELLIVRWVYLTFWSSCIQCIVECCHIVEISWEGIIDFRHFSLLSIPYTLVYSQVCPSGWDDRQGLVLESLIVLVLVARILVHLLCCSRREIQSLHPWYTCHEFVVLIIPSHILLIFVNSKHVRLAYDSGVILTMLSLQNRCRDVKLINISQFESSICLFGFVPMGCICRTSKVIRPYTR